MLKLLPETEESVDAPLACVPPVVDVVPFPFDPPIDRTGGEVKDVVGEVESWVGDREVDGEVGGWGVTSVRSFRSRMKWFSCTCKRGTDKDHEGQRWVRIGTEK